MSDALKIATSIVGLLAGVIAGVYVLGGAVIALRLLFDHFDVSSIVTVLGQLPREPVVATALMDVVAPAAIFGLVMAMLFGLFNGPSSRGQRSDALDQGGHPRILLGLVFPAIAIGLFVPAILVQWMNTDSVPWTLVPSLIGIALTYGVLAAGWYLMRRAGRNGGPRLLRALTAGAIWATIALVPTVLLAGALAFQPAQVCTAAALVPQKGHLIGEGGDRVLIEETFGREAGVVALPSDQVTQSEYGDLSSTFACPLPPGQKAAAKIVEARLGGHGSARERELAATLRPQLRFDSREPWRPVEVESFLGERFVDGSTQRSCGFPTPADCHPAKGVDELRPGPEAPTYVDIHGEAGDGTDFKSPKRRCRSARPLALDCNEGHTAVVYYRRTTHEGRWYWDYWWFLRYNDYFGPFSKCTSYLCSDHEGDWEGMTVVTTASLKPEIVGALYAAHNDRVLVEGDVLPKAGGHPVAYVAAGTHATYPYRCSGGCKQYATRAGVHLPEDPHDGTVSWGGNRDEECARYECVRPLPEVGEPDDLALPLAGAWAGWQGRWGATCHAGCDSLVREVQPSPRSPGLQTRFRCPWAATRWASPATDNSGLSESEPAGDAQRLLAFCAAQRGGL